MQKSNYKLKNIIKNKLKKKKNILKYIYKIKKKDIFLEIFYN